MPYRRSHLDTPTSSCSDTVSLEEAVRSAVLDDDFLGHCRDATGPAHLQGTLRIDERHFRATLTSFDGIELPRRTGTFFLEADDGRVYSMLDSYAHPIRWTAHNKVVISEINANRVIAGPKPWPEAQLVSAVAFTFDDAETALMSFDHLEHKFDAALPTADCPTTPSATDNPVRKDIQIIHYDRLRLFELTVNGLQLSVSLGAHSVMSTMNPKVRFVPTIRIQFPSPLDVDEATDHILNVVWFFSLSLGCPSAPRRIELAAAHADGSSVASSHDADTWFTLRYRWGNAPSDDSESHYFNRPLFSLNSPSETECLRQALAGWIQRANEWHSCYANASASLSLSREFGRERLLTAFAWFESIPWPPSAGPVTPQHAAKIADAAASAADGLGLSSAKELIRSTIGKLSAPSLRDSLTSRVAELRNRFGIDLVPPTLGHDCAAAVKLRGKLSHGKAAEVSFELMARSTEAVELINLLSLLRETSLTTEALLRLRQHPLAAYLVPRAPPQ